MPEQQETGWQLLEKTVTGHAHQLMNQPCQDAIHSKQSEDRAISMMAVADGHGSKAYFRSDQGARIAVEIAIQEMDALVSQLPPAIQNAWMIEYLLQQLPGTIVAKWRDEVAQDWRTYYSQQLEMARQSTDYASTEHFKLIQEVEQGTQNQRIRPYGATLLGVLVTPSFIFSFQIGDGDILRITLDKQRQQWQPARLVADDTRLLANETTSLCSPRASQEFRQQLYWLDGEALSQLAGEKQRKETQRLSIIPRPELIMLSTDGYANSFSTREDFLKAGPDITKELYSLGVVSVQEKLGSWLQIATEQGSGDDITLGLLWHPRSDPQEAAPPEPQEIQEPYGTPTVVFTDQHPNQATQTTSGLDAAKTQSSTIPIIGREYFRMVDTQPANNILTRLASEVVTRQPGDTRPKSAARDIHQGEMADKNIDPETTMGAPDATVIADKQQFYHRVSVSELYLSSEEMQPAKQSHLAEEWSSHAQEEASASPSVFYVSASLEKPGWFKTITEAINNSTEHTEIRIYPGTYRESLRITKSVRITCLGENRPVTLEAPAPCLNISAPQSTVTIERLLIRAHNTNQEVNNHAAVNISEGNVGLLHCDITSETRYCVMVSGLNTDTTFNNCIIHDSPGHGIFLTQNKASLLQKSRVYNHKETGIRLDNGGNVNIVESKFEHNGTGGIIQGSSTFNAQKCHFNGSQNIGLLFTSKSQGRLIACQIYDNVWRGLEINDAVVQIEHCSFYTLRSSIFQQNDKNYRAVQGRQMPLKRPYAIFARESNIHLKNTTIETVNISQAYYITKCIGKITDCNIGTQTSGIILGSNKDILPDITYVYPQN